MRRLKRIEAELTPGETIRYSARQSRYLMWFYIALCVVLAIPTIGMSLIVIPIVIWLANGNEIGLTDKRLIFKQGPIIQVVREIALPQIEGVDVIRGPLARLLGNGFVRVRGTGSAKLSLRWVNNPLALRQAINAAIYPTAASSSGRK